MAAAPQKALALIVARELASNLATPMFLIDAEGNLVFYNDAAESILGQSFGEHGPMSALEWGDRLNLTRPDGEPLRRRDSPPGIAFMERRPAHAMLCATSHDGSVHLVEVTAYPLFGRTDEMHGVVAIFWKTDGDSAELVRVRVWGCRGSVASPGPDTVRYGGNTSCVEVRTDDGVAIVLDAGTGMRPLGALLQNEGVREVHVLLTHLHLDHLQGLGFFRPLFDPDVHVHIWGPPSPVQPLADRIALYMSPPLFPVRLADIPSRITFHDAPEEPVQIGSATVMAAGVVHQGPTVGYRIVDGGSLCYLPDHEPAIGVPLAELETDWISGFELAHGVDVLLHDAQYGDGEYPDHVGWGHSAIGHVVEFARKAEVGTLVLFHHDPYHDDDALDGLRDVAAALFGRGDDDVRLAFEGMELLLGAASPSAGSPS